MSFLLQKTSCRLTFVSSVSSRPPAGLCFLGAELSGRHVASSPAGQRFCHRGRHRVLPARCEHDVPRADGTERALSASRQLCEAPPTS